MNLKKVFDCFYVYFLLIWLFGSKKWKRGLFLKCNYLRFFSSIDAVMTTMIIIAAAAAISKVSVWVGLSGSGATVGEVVGEVVGGNVWVGLIGGVEVVVDVGCGDAALIANADESCEA